LFLYSAIRISHRNNSKQKENPLFSKDEATASRISTYCIYNTKTKKTKKKTKKKPDQNTPTKPNNNKKQTTKPNSMKFLRFAQKQFRLGYRYLVYTSFHIRSLPFAHNVRVGGTAIIFMLYPGSPSKVICSCFYFLKAITLYSGLGTKSKQKTDDAELTHTGTQGADAELVTRRHERSGQRQPRSHDPVADLRSGAGTTLRAAHPGVLKPPG